MAKAHKNQIDSLVLHTLDSKYVKTFADAISGVLYCNAWRKAVLTRFDPAAARLDTLTCILLENLELSALLLEPTKEEIREYQTHRKNAPVPTESTKSLSGELGDERPMIQGLHLTRVGAGTLRRVAYDAQDGVTLPKHAAKQTLRRVHRLRQRLESEKHLRGKLNILLRVTRKLRAEVQSRYQAYFAGIFHLDIDYSRSSLMIAKNDAGNLNFHAKQLGDIKRGIDSFTSLMEQKKVVAFVLNREGVAPYLKALEELLTMHTLWKMIDPFLNSMVKAERGRALPNVEQEIKAVLAKVEETAVVPLELRS